MKSKKTGNPPAPTRADPQTTKTALDALREKHTAAAEQLTANAEELETAQGRFDRCREKNTTHTNRINALQAHLVALHGQLGAQEWYPCPHCEMPVAVNEGGGLSAAHRDTPPEIATIIREATEEQDRLVNELVDIKVAERAAVSALDIAADQHRLISRALEICQCALPASHTTNTHQQEDIADQT